MKNLLAALIVFFGFSILGMAQDVVQPVKKANDKTKVTPGTKTVTKEKTAKMPNSVVKSPSDEKTKTTKGTTTTNKQKDTISTGKLKKDGTPDKRYKNSSTKAPAGPLKKDGTPDMRYNSNKPVTK